MEADDRHCRRCGRLQSGPMLVRSVGQPEEPAAEVNQPDNHGPAVERLVPGRYAEIDGSLRLTLVRSIRPVDVRRH